MPATTATTPGYKAADTGSPTTATSLVEPDGHVRSNLQTAGAATAGRRRLETLASLEAGIIGLCQTLALLAGISRSGLAMVAGLLRGLDHEDAAKFSFLLATPSSSPPVC